MLDNNGGGGGGGGGVGGEHLLCTIYFPNTLRVLSHLIPAAALWAHIQLSLFTNEETEEEKLIAQIYQ